MDFPGIEDVYKKYCRKCTDRVKSEGSQFSLNYEENCLKHVA